MILGIGIDLVSVSRIEDLMRRFGEKFAQKIFTTSEIAKAEKIAFDDNFVPRAIFYAKRFAAKEAFVKACGLGIGRGIDFQDIEIINDHLGKPIIKILNDKEKFLHQLFSVTKLSIHLSLTDEQPLAQAMVLLEG
ncbi:MAG: holo-ACP synthase [Rickettsiales bacterium]|nr:holo-ACP synthase [Rickettsiales bacterium]